MEDTTDDTREGRLRRALDILCLGSVDGGDPMLAWGTTSHGAYVTNGHAMVIVEGVTLPRGSDAARGSAWNDEDAESRVSAQLTRVAGYTMMTLDVSRAHDAVRRSRRVQSGSAQLSSDIVGDWVLDMADCARDASVAVGVRGAHEPVGFWGTGWTAIVMPMRVDVVADLADCVVTP